MEFTAADINDYDTRMHVTFTNVTALSVIRCRKV